QSHLGLEQAALVSGEASGPRPNQGVIGLLNGGVHHGDPARGETMTDQGARGFREGRIARFGGDFQPPVAWKDSLKWQRLEPFRKFARMAEAHWDGMEAYCHEDNKVPLGFVEGLNSKIRTLQRRAHGYRDEEYFRPKILTCMLPKL